MLMKIEESMAVTATPEMHLRKRERERWGLVGLTGLDDCICNL